MKSTEVVQSNAPSIERQGIHVETRLSLHSAVTVPDTIDVVSVAEIVIVRNKADLLVMSDRDAWELAGLLMHAVKQREIVRFVPPRKKREKPAAPKRKAKKASRRTTR